MIFLSRVQFSPFSTNLMVYPFFMFKKRIYFGYYNYFVRYEKAEILLVSFFSVQNQPVQVPPFNFNRKAVLQYRYKGQEVLTQSQAYET